MPSGGCSWARDMTHMCIVWHCISAVLDVAFEKLQKESHAIISQLLRLHLPQQVLCCMQAISASMTEGDPTASSFTVGFVGADTSFTILSDADLEPHVAALKDAEDAPAGDTLLTLRYSLFIFFPEYMSGIPCRAVKRCRLSAWLQTSQF